MRVLFWVFQSSRCEGSEMEGPGSTRGSIRASQSQRGSASPPAASASTGTPGGPGAPPTAPLGAPPPLGAAPEGHSPRFPKLDECAHFHYEHVDLGPLQVRFLEGFWFILTDFRSGIRTQTFNKRYFGTSTEDSTSSKIWVLKWTSFESAQNPLFWLLPFDCFSCDLNENSWRTYSGGKGKRFIVVIYFRQIIIEVCAT